MSQSKRHSLKDAKAARGGGQFLALPVAVLQSQALANLSPYACKLLLDIASQWRLHKNGDASTAFEKIMRPRGWKSKETLYKAMDELLASGLIVKTRQGGLHKCNLFALGWLAIDECGDKLDISATTRPMNKWVDPIQPIKNKVSSTPTVPKQAKNRNLGTPAVPSG